MHKDPLYYFLIVPTIIIVIQVIIVLSIHTVKCKVHQWFLQLKKRNEKEPLIIPTSAEYTRQRALQKQKRIKLTHHKLLTQEDSNNDSNND